MANNGDYRRSLGLIDIAVQHALGGSFDTARAVLRAAFTDGQLQRPDRIGGRLQHVAAITLVNLLERRVAPSDAATTLRKVLHDMRQAPPRDRPLIVARCTQVMMHLPHINEINRALAEARKLYLRRDYVGAFTQIRAAKGTHTRYYDLTPAEAVQEITTAANMAMTHLMENNPTGKVMDITADLQQRGLIDT